MDETKPGDAEPEIVVREAEVVVSRPGSRLPVRRTRTALETVRRLAAHPAVVASASAVGAVALREGVVLARRAMAHQVARDVAKQPTPVAAPVVVVVNVLWFVHEHRWPTSTTLTVSRPTTAPY